MCVENNQNAEKVRAIKLKEIALSDSNTGSERIRAIELLGQLDRDAYDELADIAAKGLGRTERINALELLGRVAKRKSVEQQSERSERIETGVTTGIKAKKVEKVAKVEKTRNAKHMKLPKVVEKTPYKVTSSNNMPEALFNEMLYYVRPLLAPDRGVSESEIKKQFRNLKGSVVESFLTMAIKKGLIKEVTPGMFKLTSVK